MYLLCVRALECVCGKKCVIVRPKMKNNCYYLFFRFVFGIR